MIDFNINKRTKFTWYLRLPPSFYLVRYDMVSNEECLAHMKRFNYLFLLEAINYVTFAARKEPNFEWPPDLESNKFVKVKCSYAYYKTSNLAILGEE